MEKIDIYTVTALSSSKEKNLLIRGEIFNRYYVPYLKQLEILTKGRECIELGCGQGHKLGKLIASFPDINFSGLEISSEMMSKAVERLPQTKISKGDILRMENITDNSYDVVCLFQVLHHLSKESRNIAYQEIIRILKPSGHIVTIDCFRPDSNSIKQIIWDNIYRFYAVLSQYPVRALLTRTNQAITSIINPSKYTAKDFGYFPLTHKDIFGDNQSGLVLQHNITPRILKETIPCISDMLIFQKI